VWNECADFNPFRRFFSPSREPDLGRRSARLPDSIQSKIRIPKSEIPMHLTPREREKLLVVTAADLARRRQARGLRLN
jgi:hypothetical protein